ncbi:tdpt-1 [Pristionchus pacificus]|uniref:5'-tyrosyl-DNA phosphodiesterase n=1 Tax=Pristionchus pacificus TaxID=54126 RepID=A0A2A6BVD8_PRIPA|nr:tdpt-1 [Pristionchus pacificus]|eukprot:PDM69827.1 tdpt-1 [Pristionchus pacificus]
MATDVSDEDAEAAMRQFAEITGTDEILGQTILQDVNWSLDRALEVFYGGNVRNDEDGSIQVVTPPPPAVEQSQADSPNTPEDMTGFEISLLSWNIDGLDGNSLATRMLAVYKIVSRISADFVFLQEVVERDIDKLLKLKNSYNMYFSNRSSMYFTAILVSNAFSVRNHDVIHYQNSGMDRTLQLIEGTLGPFQVFLLNTHLESMAEHSDKRRQQLEQCMNKIASISNEHPNALIFFGGDLNVRDRELPGLPKGFADAWIAAGQPKSEEYTWDTRTNTNKQSFHTARCRFDRIFYKAQPLNKVSFALEGKQLIRTSLCYASDHWAIHSTFSV